MQPHTVKAMIMTPLGDNCDYVAEHEFSHLPRVGELIVIKSPDIFQEAQTELEVSSVIWSRPGNRTIFKGPMNASVMTPVLVCVRSK
jgi:hypothetical protein